MKQPLLDRIHARLINNYNYDSKISLETVRSNRPEIFDLYCKGFSDSEITEKIDSLKQKSK